MVQIGFGRIYIHIYLLRKPRERRRKKRKPLFFSFFSIYCKQSTTKLSAISVRVSNAKKRRVKSIGADSFLIKNKIVDLCIIF